MNGKFRKEQHLSENLFRIFITLNFFLLLLFINLMQPLVNKSINFFKEKKLADPKLLNSSVHCIRL